MKSNWKKMLIASMACVALTGVSATSFAAGYSLNPEVKTATPALLQASEIGVRTYNTTDAELQKAPNKDAIVVMSFGTTYKDTRAKTIEATVEEIQKAHPNTKVVLAFTSHIIIDRVKANEGITIPTPEEALAQLKAEGYNRIALTSLDIIPGMEYAYKTAVYDIYKTQFKKMTIGTPLMYWMGQEGQRDDVEAVMQAIGSQMPKLGKKDAVLVMAHGTPDPSNAYYSVMQDRLNKLYDGKVMIYTVEGWPSLEDIIPQLKAKGINHVTMMPLMMVAGDHANNDMAGDDEDSWKSMFNASGAFESVDCQIAGLGGIEAIQQIYVDHTKAAMEELGDAAVLSTVSVDATELADGTYSAKFNTDSSMFAVNEANDGRGVLTVKDGKMTIHISLASQKIVNLFVGTAEDAAKEGAELLQPTIDTVTYADGTTEEVNGYDVPVEALDKEFDLAIIGTKQKWYDHKVSVSDPQAE